MAGELEQARVEADVIALALEDDALEVVVVMCPPQLCGRPAATTRPDLVDCVIAAT